MTEILGVAFLFLGLLGMLNKWHIGATGYRDDLAYHRSPSSIPRYQEDGQLRQFRRQERERDRRAEEPCWHW
jgi:hypothetical protein